MASLDDRPTCDTCWFSKVKGVATLVPPAARFCLRDPHPVEKDDDDFCQHHPAWPEFEAIMQGEQISDFYDTQEDD